MQIPHQALVVRPSRAKTAISRASRSVAEALERRTFFSAGAVDATFGRGGEIVVGVRESADDHALTISITPNHRVLLGGFSINPGTDTTLFAAQELAFARFTPGGTLDSTFTGDGRLVPDIGPLKRWKPVTTLALPDGKVLVSLRTDNEYDGLIARFNADGSLDATFGNAGGVTIANTAPKANQLAVLPDGRILVNGYADILQFSSNGKDLGVFAPLADGFVWPDLITVQQDGKVLVATRMDGGVRRFLANGKPDVTFAGGGIAALPFTGYSRLVATPQGIVVGGMTHDESTGADSNLLVCRLTARGKRDTAFAGGKTVDTRLHTFGNDFDGTSFMDPTLVVEPDGTIVALGGLSTTGALTRIKPNGNIAGTQLLAADLYPAGLAVETNGSFYVAATNPGPWINAADTSRGDFVLLHYQADGTQDLSFGSGRGVADFRNNAVTTTAAAPAPGGKVVAVGYLGSEFDPNRNVVMRFNADGSLDSSFGDGGVVRTRLGLGSAPSSVLVQPDGAILIGRSVARNPNASDSDFSVMRLRADGSLDTSFGVRGETQTDVDGASNDSLNTLALLPNGKILAAGSAGESKFGIVRYNADGTLDETFGDHGRARTVFDAFDGVAVSRLVVNPDGTILAVGVAEISAEGNDGGSHFESDYALAKYLPDGRPDKRFGIGGKVQTGDVGSSDTLRIVGALPRADGSVVIGTANAFGNGFGLVRFSATGVLSKTFGKSPTPLSLTFGEATTMISGPDGSIYMGGTFSPATAGFDTGLIVARFDYSGAFDPTFGLAGVKKLLGPTPSQASLAALLPAADGKLLAVGSVSDGSSWRAALVRFDPNAPVVSPQTDPARLVGDSDVDAGASVSGTTSLALGDIVLFDKISSDPKVNGLWKTDGTSAGTVRISPQIASNLLRLGSVALFNVTDEQSDLQLWRTDGTPAGTYSLGVRISIDPYTIDLFRSDDGIIYFPAPDQQPNRFAIWRSDGTLRGTRVLRGGLPAFPSLLQAVGSNVFFSMYGSDSYDLWVTNGTAAGTRKLANIEAAKFGTVRGKAVFSATDETHGTEIWVSDGTVAGTKLLKDIDPGPDSSFPEYAIDFKGRIYFAASGLWATDGTPAGTVRISDATAPSQTPVVVATGSTSCLTCTRCG